jgi:hypothetical protein
MRTYSPSLLFSPSLVVAFFDAVVYARLLSPPHSPSLCVNRYKTRERERENVSGAVLENASERELKMKDTRQIGKIAYEFLSLFSFFFCLLTILVTKTLCIRHAISLKQNGQWDNDIQYNSNRCNDI